MTFSVTPDYPDTEPEPLDLDACVDNLAAYAAAGDIRSCRDITLAVIAECRRLRQEQATTERSEDAAVVVAEAKVRKLTERLDAAHEALARIVDDDIATTLESAVEYVVKRHRQILQDVEEYDNEVVRLGAEIQRLTGQYHAMYREKQAWRSRAERVRALCDEAEADPRDTNGGRWEDPTPIPGWTTAVRQALAGPDANGEYGRTGGEPS